MALYNGVTKAELESTATMLANETERLMGRLKYFVGGLAPFDQATLDGLGLSADYQANLGSVKTDFANLEAWYRANCAFVRRFSKLTNY